jgi:hypothetical protein
MYAPADRGAKSDEEIEDRDQVSTNYGEPCRTEDRPANRTSLGFSVRPVRARVAWLVRGLFSFTRAITCGSGTAARLKAHPLRAGSRRLRTMRQL